VNGLGVGEIGEYFLRGLGDDIITLRHSVPQLSFSAFRAQSNLSGGFSPSQLRAFLAPHDEEKPSP